MNEFEVKQGVTVDAPDADGEIRINIEGDRYDPETYIYLNKDQVEKLLSLFE